MIKVVKWIYLLEDDYQIELRLPLPDGYPDGYTFYDYNLKPRLVIDKDGIATILKGYAWDGCTPKFSLLDLVIGIPDGIPHQTTKKPKAYYASLVHDALYQFLDFIPIKRKHADLAFLHYLERDDFAPRTVYYYAVVLFGGMFRWFFKTKREYNKNSIKQIF